jgi:hypothetical protein
MAYTDNFSHSSAETWGYTCAVPAEPRGTSRARDFVRYHLIEGRLLHLVDTVRLVASELVANAVGHARTRSTLTLSRSGSVVKLELTDGSAQPPTRRPTSQEETLVAGEFSIGMLDALSLEWGVINDSNRTRTIWGTFDAYPCARPVTASAVGANAV